MTPEELDVWVLQVVLSEIGAAAQRYGVTLTRVDSSSYEGREIVGRNFLVGASAPRTGFRHWTVWLDPHNPLLEESCLRDEADRHVYAFVRQDAPLEAA